MKKGRLKVRNAILCEDIRHEKNNKFTLVGTYFGDILVQSIPAKIALGFLLDLDVPEGDTVLEARMSGPGKDSAVLTALFSQPKAGAGTLATPRMDVVMEKEGVFRVDVRMNKERWTNVIKKRIILDPSIGPQRPSEQSPPDAPESSQQPEPSRPSRPKRQRKGPSKE